MIYASGFQGRKFTRNCRNMNLPFALIKTLTVKWLNSLSCWNYIEFTAIPRICFVPAIKQRIKGRHLIPFLHTIQYHCVQIPEDSPQRDTSAHKKVCLNRLKLKRILGPRQKESFSAYLFLDLATLRSWYHGVMNRSIKDPERQKQIQESLWTVHISLQIE